MSRPFSDDELDDMHHALGRPAGPDDEGFYRNHYVTELDGEQGRAMRASSGWRLTGTMNRGRDGVFSVTDEGQVAMFAWLAGRHARAGLRRYVVEARGVNPRPVLAKSPAAAKYDLFLHLSDAWSLSFREFVAMQPRVRLATRAAA